MARVVTVDVNIGVQRRHIAQELARRVAVAIAAERRVVITVARAPRVRVVVEVAEPERPVSVRIGATRVVVIVVVDPTAWVIHRTAPFTITIAFAGDTGWLVWRPRN